MNLILESVCNHGEITQASSDVSCRSFFLCSHGHKILMTCAPGTMFDPKCFCCNHLNMVSCSTTAASIMKGYVFNLIYRVIRSKLDFLIGSIGSHSKKNTNACD